MATTLDRFEAIKKKVEELKSQKDRAEGALQQQMARLHDEFDCETIEEAEALLKKLEDRQSQLQTEFDHLVEEFESEFGEKLA